MPLIPLLPIFHSFNREFFLGQLAVGSTALISVRWSDGRLRKTAGLYRRGPMVEGPNASEIVLSRPLLENLPVTAIESTLCHEMIHGWIDLVLRVEEVHGINFRRRMAAINAAQNRFQVTIRHQFPTPKSLPKWWAVCPSCSARLPYKRLVRGAACRKCCEIHYGGHWHPSCLLSYEPVLEEA